METNTNTRLTPKQHIKKLLDANEGLRKEILLKESQLQSYSNYVEMIRVELQSKLEQGYNTEYGQGFKACSEFVISSIDLIPKI